MVIRSLIDPIRHALKIRKHKDFRFHIWTMDDIGLAYVSTPKVASNSIRRVIRQRQAKILLSPEQVARPYKEYKPEIDKLIKQSILPSKINAIKGDSYFFSFVRNPLARLYSCYRDKVQNGETVKDRCTLSPYGIEFGISFDDFVYRVAEIPDNKSNEHFRSLNTFLTYQGKSFVDHVGKIESINDDWRPIHERFGLNYPQRDERTRRVSGPSIPFMDLPYTRQTAELAANRYARDIELYGYGNDIDQLIENLGNR